MAALLQLARASQAELKRQSVDTQAVLAELAAELQASREALVVEVHELPPVDADPTLLRQVFMNLITNALKFTQAGATPRVQVGTRADSEGPVYFVRDNGVGFSAERAQRLFQPFQRLHGAQYEGFGLGLSIVKRIIDRHGGQVWAEGAPGQGATFYVSFGK